MLNFDKLRKKSVQPPVAILKIHKVNDELFFIQIHEISHCLVIIYSGEIIMNIKNLIGYIPKSVAKYPNKCLVQIALGISINYKFATSIEIYHFSRRNELCE